MTAVVDVQAPYDRRRCADGVEGATGVARLGVAVYLLAVPAVRLTSAIVESGIRFVAGTALASEKQSLFSPSLVVPHGQRVGRATHCGPASHTEQDNGQPTVTVDAKFFTEKRPSGYGGFTYADEVELNFTISLAEMAEDGDEPEQVWRTLQTSRQTCQQQTDLLIAWRKKLAEIPYVQRQAKAHLTDVLLQQTEPGRQLYQTLQGQFHGNFQQLRPVPDAYRRYLPDASRLDNLPSYGGYALLVLPMPVVSGEEGLTEQVQAAVRAAGPIWLAETDVPHCRKQFPAEDGYYVALQTLPLDLEQHRCGSRWRSHTAQYVEVRYAPRSARRSLHARRYLSKRDAVSVAEICHLIDALAHEARLAGRLTGYRPQSWPRAGVHDLVWSLNTVLAVHRTVCGRWAYRQNPQYVRFVEHARATQRVTVRKFPDRGFRAWLQRELRSRAVRRAASRSGKHDVSLLPTRETPCLPLPFDDALAAEESRTGTANGSRISRR